MLADDILAAATDNRKDHPWHRQMIDRLAAGLRQAQRFTVDPAVLDEAHELLRVTPMAGQLKALAVCILPFEACWFEWSEGNGERFGVLVGGEAQHGTAMFGFMAERDACASPIVASFDWREQLPLLAPAAEPLSDEVWAEIQAGARERGIRRESREAFDDFRRRHTVAVASDLPALPLEQDVLRDLQNEAFHKLQYLRAVILLMNSPKYTRAEPQVASEKLQRARVKSGKAPLLDHTRITISLSHAPAQLPREGEGGDGERGSVRWHSVRGHPRVLPKGAVRVRPHSRGSVQAGVIDHQTRHIKP